MKKNLSLRAVSFAAAMAMLLLLASCKKDPETPVTFQGDTSSTSLNVSHTLDSLAQAPDSDQLSITYGEEASKAYFSLIGEATQENGVTTLPKSTVAGVAVATKFAEDQAVNYEITMNFPKSSSPSSTVFLGFRLTSTTAGANNTGVWLAINGKKIGMRAGAWPTVALYNNPVGIDFSTSSKIYITDDPVSNTITVYANDTNGVKQELGHCTIAEGEIKFFTPDREKARRTYEVDFDIPLSGYSNIWAHHTSADAVVSEFKVSGKRSSNGVVLTPNMLASRDTFEDTWVSTDDEGRTTIQSAKNPTDKKVGIFYFLWHNGTSSEAIYDHSAAYAEGGVEKLEEVMTQGPVGFAHYWAEPYFGYYRSDDEWVLRKHANQLTAAGVDFVFFDFTNGNIYERNLITLLTVWNQMRIEGQQVPQVAFNLGKTDDLVQSSFTSLYSLLFSSDKFSDMIFKWEGKPLMLAPDSYVNTLEDEVKEKFTFRECWAFTNESADWYSDTNGNGCWPWADIYPQGPGKSEDGEVEQMVVMCGYWANGSAGTNGGRSYANGKLPAGTGRNYSFSIKTSGQGLAFQEQFDYAIENDPEVIMITGWNEWWAGRWVGGDGTGQRIAASYFVDVNDPVKKNYFVDCFSPEYSRDIEPVKGLFNDNYYYQMAQNIRAFKGTRSLQTAFGQKTIDLAADISQWYSVGPEYRDHIGDTAHRDCMSYVGQLHYTNTTGRNDFINAKVSVDGDSVYFMAECAANITGATGTNWMNLFIDADANSSTGWYGYDYIINRSQNGSKCSVEKFNGTGWELSSAGEADFTVNGKYITVKVAKSVVSFSETFDFKWADNSVSDGDVMQFIDLGDTAPSERFNYRYTTAAQAEKLPDILTDSMIVLKAGSYNAYVGKKSVMLDTSNTNAVMLGINNEVYLPKAFCQNSLGIDVSSMTSINHYGTEYVEVGAAIDAMGKTVTRGENIIVIADKQMSENELLTLYRSLY